MTRSTSIPAALLAIAMISACGGGGGGGGSGPVVDPPATGGPPRLELVAGAFGGVGSNDGDARFARMFQPHGVTVDAAGRIFIADTDNRTIRVLSGGQVSTVAGEAGTPGFADGSASAARFNNPEDVVVDPAGNLFVADTLNHSIRRIAPDGVVTTLAGNGTAGYADGAGSLARFDRPRGIARNAQGTLFVADERNHVVRAISPSGVVSTVAGQAGTSAFADGAANAARFSFPGDVAVDAQGAVLVADSGNYVLRRIANGAVTTVAGVAGSRGTADGASAQARFSALGGVAADAAGNAFVTDAHRVRRVDAGGMVTTIAGPLDSTGITGRRDGAGTAALFDSPRGLAVAADGVVVADTGNDTVRRMTFSGQVTTLVGDFAGERFSSLAFGARDGQGRIVVSDRLALRAVGADGSVTTIASHPFPEGLETAQLEGVAVETSGAVLAVDLHCALRFGPGAGLPRACAGAITRVAADGTFGLVAGSTAQSGATDGIGANARFQEPNGIAVTAAGVIYVADSARDTIRRIALDGSVTTLAGSDDSCPLFGPRPAMADGAGVAARFCGPTGVAVDPAGNVYVADSGYAAIRKISATGVVSTLAGGGGSSCSTSGDGVGAPARFCALHGIAVDSAGVVYVTDRDRVRRISAAGEVTTIAGVAGSPGFAPGPLPGRLTNLVDVVVSGPDLYIVMTTAVAVIRNRP